MGRSDEKAKDSDLLMPTSGPVTVAFQTNTPSPNGQGQLTESWSNMTGLASVSATWRLRTPQWKLDPVGGGQRLISTAILIIEPPIAAITEVTVNETNRLLINGTEYWRVTNTRLYGMTQQFDIEEIGGL